MSARFVVASSFAAIAALTAVCFVPPTHAQDALPAPLTTRKLPPGVANMRVELERMQYNVERGPLLVVALPSYFKTRRELPDPDAPGATPLIIADAFDRRIVKAGSLTVIAPREMTVINDRLAKPDPYVGLEQSERGQALLGTLSEAQWQKASGNGLSLADLTPEQTNLLGDSLHGLTSAQPMKAVVSPDQPGVTHLNSDGDPIPVQPDQLRLRLSRIPQYMLTREGQTESGYSSGPSQRTQEGERTHHPLFKNDSEYYQQSRTRNSVQGVPLVQNVPARLKRSELDFADPVFDPSVSLSADAGALLTVAQLLERIGKATRLEFRGDARVAGLPVFVRAAPGQTVRAGDLLMALAHSISGAYRRLDARFFLLTDDVEGIGTRFARLQAWGDTARQVRQDLLFKSLETASEQDPLRFLKPTPGTTAFPDDLLRKIETAWKKPRGEEGVSLPLSALPPAVRKDVEAAFQTWENMTEPVHMKKDAVKVGMAIKMQWVLPGGEVLSNTDRLPSLNPYSLSSLLPKEKRAAPETAPPPKSTVGKTKAPPMPPLFPPTLARRVVVLSPATTSEARQLMQAARIRGFNEFWIYTPLAGSDTAPLRAAIIWGKARKLPVYLATSVSRHTGVSEAERTILGQTGAEWAASYVGGSMFEVHPEWRHDGLWQSDRYIGWTTPGSSDDETALAQKLLTLAAVPGITGLCLKETTPPGYGGENQTGDGIMGGGEMGYTRSQRIGFTRTHGYDPVDLVPDVWSLTVDKSLPLFPHEPGQRYKEVAGKYVIDTDFAPPSKLWKRYRDEQVRARLARLHQKLRAAHPKLPLYLDDRASAYTSANLSWFGSWDSADTLPRNPVYGGDAEATTAARVASLTRLARVGWDRLSHKPQEPEWFLGSARRAADRAAKPGLPWHGMAVDLSLLNRRDALEMLGALPLSVEK